MLPAIGTPEYEAKLSSSIARFKASCEKIAAMKRARAPQFITKPPVHEQIHKMAASKCQARTLENRPCPFRATSKCGRFCSKHNVV